MSEAELANLFRNVQRVARNHGRFPADLSPSDKAALLILARAIFESDFSGDAYDVLRDAIERERGGCDEGQSSI